MTLRRNAFVNFLIFTIAFTEVATWTIDLPEVRKFLFEKNEKHKKHNDRNEYEDYLSNDRKFYSNIEGNSKHNEHHDYDREKYAEDYDYHHTYMEKKVYNIVSDGSSYLEGLRRSLEDYNMILISCNGRNSSMQNSTSSNSTSQSWSPAYDPPSNSSDSTNSSDSSSTSILNFQNYDNSTVPMRPRVLEEGRRGSSRNRSRMSCEEATESSEQIRRYAELALWATGRLQDMAYAKKYEKTDEQEENELILKLAWFLDRLAYLSGYEPQYKEYLYEPSGTRSTPTNSPTSPTLVPSSDEYNQQMRDCLQRNSSEPATERCRYTMQMPDLMSRVFEDGSTSSSSSSSGSPSSSGSSDSSISSDPNSVLPMSRQPDSLSEQSSEILVTADNYYENRFLQQKSPITKRSTDYTFYYPPKPMHELTYPAPIVKVIKHKLSNIKSVVKTIVERRLAHIAEKIEEKKQHEHHHFEKRSVDNNNVPTANFIKPSSIYPKPLVKSVEKRPLDEVSLGLTHYPVSDVSVINTKSFKKRSIDERRITPNHINRLSNLKSILKSIEKGPIFKKTFENFLSAGKMTKRMWKYPVSEIKSVQKRSQDDPLTKLANYYIKYKVWDNSNPIYTKKNFVKKGGIFEVKNQLNEPKIITKRSLFNKKVIHLHLPKPSAVVRTLVHGHRPHHNIPKSKLLAHLHKLHDLKHKKVEKLHKNIKKRSIHYEHMYLPRYPVDPQGDISYYIKNKEGTNYNPSVAQAAQVRLGLEQVFQTGNIEIVRRYGANFNPLNPAPFYTGVLASMADA